MSQAKWPEWSNAELWTWEEMKRLGWTPTISNMKVLMAAQSSPSAPSSQSSPPPAAYPNPMGIKPGDLVMVTSLTHRKTGHNWVVMSPDGQNYLKVGDRFNVYSVDIDLCSTPNILVVYRSPGQLSYFGKDLQCIPIDMVAAFRPAAGASASGCTFTVTGNQFIASSNGQVTVDFTDHYSTLPAAAPAEAECKCRSLLWGHERGCPFFKK